MSDFVQLQTFVEVAHARSFSGAAKRLDLPRSTVTARVRALEARLNTRLLQRTTRVVTVTEDGKRYLDACEQALATLGNVEDDLVSRRGVSGLIRLSVPADFPMDQLARTLGAFTLRHPAVQIEVDVSDRTVPLVEDGFDLALRGRNLATPGLVARKVASTPLGVYVAPAQSRKRSLPLLDPLQADGANDAGVQPAITTLSLALAREMAVAGQVVAVLPDDLCRQDVKEGRLRRVRAPAIKARLELFLVYPSRHHLPVRVRALLDELALAWAPGHPAA